MIGIIAAMQAEVDALLERMDHYDETTQDGISFWEGTLKGKSVILMLSGVGKGNAAIATTLLCKNFAVDCILNIGTAGGLKQEQEVLDIVISDTVVQHDYDTSPLDGEEGIGKYYQADSELVSLCQKICFKLQERSHIGMIASGDQFMSGAKALQLLQRFPKASCAEMEAGAIAQACSHFQKPFVVLRSLSDIALKQDNPMDFQEYVHKASARSAQFCEVFVEQLQI